MLQLILFDLQLFQYYNLYEEIDSTHLNKEFIYFSYIENGVTDAGAVKGSYRGSKIIKINKFYDKIDFTIENTSFY